MDSNDLEDGEIDSFDNDDAQPVYNPLPRPEVPINRISQAQNSVEPSSDEGEAGSSSDSDSDDCSAAFGKPKKKKAFRASEKIAKDGGGSAFQQMAAKYQDDRARQGLPTRGKKNNVWGSILQEDSLTSGLTGIGVRRSLKDLNSDRGAETYDFRFAHEVQQNERREAEKARKESERNSLDEELQQYWKSGPDAMDADGDRSGSGQSMVAGRKRTIKDRLGARRKGRSPSDFEDMSIPQPGVPRTIPDLDPRVLEDPADNSLGEELANKLCEPKAELMIGVVETFGAAVALDLFSKTQKIENDGGLMIKNGARRRTPGGIFLHLLREVKDERIDATKVKKFFAASNAMAMQAARNKKKRSNKNFRSGLGDFKKFSQERKKEAANKESEEMEEGGEEKEEEEEELKPLPDILNLISQSMNKSGDEDKKEKDEQREPAPFEEPEAPPNSVGRVERTVNAYDDDFVSQYNETEDIELF